MVVYVDDALIPARVGRISSRWSHLFADTQDELHEFAASIGLQRRWFQGGPKRKRTWHYDVTESKRQEAIKAGAKEVTWRESVQIMNERDGICGCSRAVGECAHCGRPADQDHKNRCHRAAVGGAQQPEPAKETPW